jgi:hypothetical protein
LTEARHDDLMSLVLVLLYQHSQSRRVHLTLLICVSRQQPISTIRRQHSLRTRLWRSRFSDGDVTGFTSDERKWVAVRGPLQIKAGADDHFKVSVVSSDPTMTATRASLKTRDEIPPKARRSKHHGVELLWLLSYGENK